MEKTDFVELAKNSPQEAMLALHEMVQGLADIIAAIEVKPEQ